MNLREYIRDSERRKALVADVERNSAYLYQVATGRRRASTDLAQAIEKHTKGKVAKHSLRPDVWSKRAARRRRRTNGM